MRVRIRDLAYETRVLATISGRRVLCEVIYVRRASVSGDRRIVLRRIDTGSVLRRARSIDEISPATAGQVAADRLSLDTSEW